MKKVRLNGYFTFFIMAASGFMFFTIDEYWDPRWYITSVKITYLISIAVNIGIFIRNKTESKKREEKRKEENKIIVEETDVIYQKIKEKINIPTGAKLVKSLKYKQLLPRGSYYIWKNENEIVFFPSREMVTSTTVNALTSKISIEIGLIKSFYLTGEVYRENKISGGGGGGSSLSKGIIGGVVAGAPGAVVASRRKNNPIKSELIKHDTRKVKLVYLTSMGNEDEIEFSYKSENVLKSLIPQKEKSIVESIEKSRILNNIISKESGKVEKIESTSDIVKKIREFSDLKNDGIITEKEFEEKKQLLLKKII